MATGLELPFAIGDVMWLPGHAPTQVTVACPVCAGNRVVVVTLGSGEQLSVPCDGCGLGFDGPRGVIEQWVYEPVATRFQIAKVKSMRDDEWYIESIGGGCADFANLVATEAEALALSRQKCEEQREENMRRMQHTRKNVQRVTWSVRYHREKIEDLERQLAWHRGKVQKTSVNRAEAKS